MPKAAVFGIAVACALLLASSGSERARADESQATKDAYRNYVTAVEARLDARNDDRNDGRNRAGGQKFLWLDQDPQRLAAARKGEVPIQQIDTPSIPDGTLEHWIGGEFLPGVTLDLVLRVDQDYANYARYYAPEILQSRLLSRDGNRFSVFYRIRKHEVVTVVLDTTHEIDFVPLGKDRYFIRSHGVHIREVQNAGKSDEKTLPEGQGIGFLWGMDSYWRMEQRDGGVYIECEVVTLGRSVPFGMGRLVRSVIDSVARDSLTNTLVAKRKAVLATR